MVDPERCVFGFAITDGYLLKIGRERGYGKEEYGQGDTPDDAAMIVEMTGEFAYVEPTRALGVTAELFAVKRRQRGSSCWFLAIGSNAEVHRFRPPPKEKIQEIMDYFKFTKPPRWAELV
ncbi:hypothetical protein BDZ89DRAFT_1161813 [Hymenopellis radicata]|nr:hypothetical protein BDZ89DRAFT_1161813 [Hymenopellis radicata]